jgi:hypothetical protein
MNIEDMYIRIRYIHIRIYIERDGSRRQDFFPFVFKDIIFRPVSEFWRIKWKIRNNFSDPEGCFLKGLHRHQLRALRKSLHLHSHALAPRREVGT